MIKTSLITFLVVVSLVLVFADAHYIKKINKKALSINGYANQPK